MSYKWKENVLQLQKTVTTEMKKRKTYNQAQLQELVDDLNKAKFDFAVEYNCKSRSLKLYTHVKSYFYPVDESIQKIVIYPINELHFKNKQSC